MTYLSITNFKNYTFQLQKIAKLGTYYLSLTDNQIKSYVYFFKKKLKNNQKKHNIIVKAFALIREGISRVLNIREYDTQILGALILTQGKIAEMKTGEGKTLVSILPVFLNALYTKGTHVITINDYLAERDSDSVGSIYRFLGLSVGLIHQKMSFIQRRLNYA